MTAALRWFCALAVACGVGAATTLPAEPAPAPDPPARPSAAGAVAASRVSGGYVRAFFSGHSLLDNPLPDWVESIADSRGDKLAWQEQIVLGSPIRVRTKGENPSLADFSGYRLGKDKDGGKIDVLRELANPRELGGGERYERLVITERPDLLGTIEWENTIGYLRDYHDRVVQQNPRAGSLLYQVWPELDKKNPRAWIAYVHDELFVWECVAARVNHGLAAEGRADRVAVIPGGLALAELVELALSGGVPGLLGSPEQRISALFTDEVHLTPLGIYFMAAVHYGVLFGKTPVGAAVPPTVNRTAAPVLQRVAWDTLSAYRPRATRAPNLAECRRRLAEELCPAYLRFHRKPEDRERCRSWAKTDSPFASPSPAGARGG